MSGVFVGVEDGTTRKKYLKPFVLPFNPVFLLVSSVSSTISNVLHGYSSLNVCKLIEFIIFFNIFISHPGVALKDLRITSILLPPQLMLIVIPPP
jgi:hypothetical protein